MCYINETSAALLLTEIYIGFIFCDLQRYVRTTSVIGQATAIMRLTEVHN